MAARQRTHIFVALFAITLLAVLGLLVVGVFSGGSASGTLQSGRTVTTHSDSIYLSSSFSSDTATITSGQKTIVVQPAALIVEGISVASIAPSSMDVRVTIAKGDVSFVVDGRPVSLTH